MKKRLSLIVLVLFLINGCSKERPEPPRSNRELIVGRWLSQTATYKVGVNNNRTVTDSAETGIELIFTGEDSYVYTNLLIDTVTERWLFTRDTLRYNFDPATEDTLFFIEDFRARDTLFIENLTENELSVVVEDYSIATGSALYREQVIVNFTKAGEGTNR